MSSSLKDARWMRAIDHTTAQGIDFQDLPYEEKKVHLDEAQQYLDVHPEKIEGLAKRFNQHEPEAQPWVEESPTAFAIRATKADGVRLALLYARTRVDPSGTAQALADAIDEYLADLERPIHTPSRFTA